MVCAVCGIPLNDQQDYRQRVEGPTWRQVRVGGGGANKPDRGGSPTEVYAHEACTG
jgi:hypothetical protein